MGEVRQRRCVLLASQNQAKKEKKKTLKTMKKKKKKKKKTMKKNIPRAQTMHFECVIQALEMMGVRWVRCGSNVGGETKVLCLVAS